MAKAAAPSESGLSLCRMMLHIVSENSNLVVALKGTFLKMKFALFKYGSSAFLALLLFIKSANIPYKCDIIKASGL